VKWAINFFIQILLLTGCFAQEVREIPGLTGQLVVACGTLDLSPAISNDVEVVDFSSTDASCTQPPSYPFNVDGPAGFFLGGKPTICGGDVDALDVRKGQGL
jgi:hypothetical protein